MTAKTNWIGLAIAGAMMVGGVQASEQRFETQIDAELTRTDIIERAAGETSKTVRPESNDWGKHSVLSSNVAEKAVLVINRGADLVMGELETTRGELKDTQNALNATQAALNIAKSDLQATQSSLSSLETSTAAYQTALNKKISDLQKEVEKAGGSGGAQITYKTVTKSQQYLTHWEYDSYYRYYMGARYTMTADCVVTYMDGVPVSGRISRWAGPSGEKVIVNNAKTAPYTIHSHTSIKASLTSACQSKPGF